jgi:toxin ParE1/3/4
VTTGKGAWHVLLAEAALSDYREILLWTREHFGEQQASYYAQVIDDALAELSNGPSLPGVRARDDLARGLFLLHVASNKRKGRHFIAFRVKNRGNERVVDVLRILHDAMDLPRHLSSPSEESGSQE